MWMGAGSWHPSQPTALWVPAPVSPPKLPPLQRTLVYPWSMLTTALAIMQRWYRWKAPQNTPGPPNFSFRCLARAPSAWMLWDLLAHPCFGSSHPTRVPLCRAPLETPGLYPQVKSTKHIKRVNTYPSNSKKQKGKEIFQIHSMRLTVPWW